jgi:hypothetical protein
MNCIETITCMWTGRHEDSVKVIGATSIEEARKHAMEFFNLEAPDGITLDGGYSVTWDYEEPQPADWQDYYVFNSIDEYQPDQREWWEK